MDKHPIAHSNQKSAHDLDSIYKQQSYAGIPGAATNVESLRSRRNLGQSARRENRVPSSKLQSKIKSFGMYQSQQPQSSATQRSRAPQSEYEGQLVNIMIPIDHQEGNKTARDHQPQFFNSKSQGNIQNIHSVSGGEEVKTQRSQSSNRSNRRTYRGEVNNVNIRMKLNQNFITNL